MIIKRAWTDTITTNSNSSSHGMGYFYIFYNQRKFPILLYLCKCFPKRFLPFIFQVYLFTLPFSVFFSDLILWRKFSQYFFPFFSPFTIKHRKRFYFFRYLIRLKIYWRKERKVFSSLVLNLKKKIRMNRIIRLFRQQIHTWRKWAAETKENNFIFFFFKLNWIEQFSSMATCYLFSIFYHWKINRKWKIQAGKPVSFSHSVFVRSLHQQPIILHFILLPHFLKEHYWP